MADLSFTGNGSDSGNENNLGDNIWYNRGTIKSATDTSDEIVTFGDKEVKFDIAVLLEVAIDSLQYPKKVTVSGNFRKDHTGSVVDWGGAFKIQKLFQAAGITGKLVNNQITKESLNSLLGKEVSFINYKKKDGKFATWARFYPVNAPKEVIKKDFLKDRARIDKGGYINNYDSGDSLPNQISDDSSKEAWMQKDDLPQGNLSFDNSTKFMG